MSEIDISGEGSGALLVAGLVALIAKMLRAAQAPMSEISNGGRGPRALAVGLFVVCWLLLALPAAAQEAEGSEALGPECVSFSVGPDHWLGPALLRLQGLGVLPGHVPAQRSVPLCGAYLALHGAAADTTGNAHYALAGALLERLKREFPGLERLLVEEAVRGIVHASAAAAAVDRAGIGAPGGGEFPLNLRGTIELEDRSFARAELDAGVLANRRISLRVVTEADPDNARFEVLEGVIGMGPWALTLGRGQVGYGTATSGGIVLDQGQFDRIQFETHRAVVLPGILRPLGRLAFTTMLTRLREERHDGNPYFWGASASLQPHWRAIFSVHRAAMVQAENGEFPITARNIANLLLGRVIGGGFENQVLSVEGRFHLPTDTVVPLTVYLEWGFEDAAGAWWDVPGRVIGLNIPAVPGIPTLSLGLERSSFAPRCCGNPIWYRHVFFPGGWAFGDRTLGHPLGGHGVEWLVYGGVDLDTSRTRVDARGFRRNREAENLFVPGREGSSWGFGSTVRWRIGSIPEIFGALDFERGEDWRQYDVSIGGRFTLP